MDRIETGTYRINGSSGEGPKVFGYSRSSGWFSKAYILIALTTMELTYDIQVYKSKFHIQCYARDF